MKNLIALFLALTVFACSPDHEVVQVTQGVPGAQGDTGATGAQGANGHSLVSEIVPANDIECATSGSRLDIYLDLDDSLSVSTGDVFQSSLIACDGANGLTGSDGTNGLPGVQGPQGDPGTDGAIGPQGIPGAQGPQGVAGNNGTNGTNGTNGSQGIAGPAGTVGPQGSQGVAGPVGPAGPQGPQGTAGAQGATGSGATIHSYTLTSSCQSIGSSLYAKANGNDAKIYSSSTCSNQLYGINDNESQWLNATTLAFVDATTGTALRVINFN